MEIDNCEYVQLHNLRTSSVSSDDTTSSESVDSQIKRPARNKPTLRPLCWTICSATATYTTNRLMVNHNYHYPATIAFRIFGLTLLVYMVTLFMGAGPSHAYDQKWSSHGLGRKRWWLQQLPNLTWKGMLPVSIVAATSLPMLLQGVLHMPNLPALVMLFPIIPAAESLVLYIYYRSQPPQEQYQKLFPPWWALTTILASAVLLYNDYRLTVPGLIWGVAGVLSFGVWRAFFALESRNANGSEERLRSFHGFIIMTLFFGMVFSSTIAYAFELPAGLNLPLKTLVLMLVNTAAFVATAFTGTSLLVYSPISLTDGKLSYSAELSSGVELLASFASSILVLVAILLSQPATVVSWAQIIAYLVATLCVLRLDQAHASVIEATILAQQVLRKFSKDSTIGNPSKVVSFSTVTFIVASLAFALSFLDSTSLASIASPDSSVLDLSYNASTTFDIVVSAYLEEPESIKSMLDSIKKTVYISNLRPNVIVYTKDPEANITALEETTGANVVRLLENVGREGGTYLQHIISNWDTLAEKTMFIQAHAHNMRELLPRINSYLVENTGMLSLGFAGVTCDCSNCHDRWGWEDYDNVIPTLYQEIYKQTCDSNTPILLSYKGQFVASAKRIRGIDKSICQKLLLAITTREGWGHGRHTFWYEDSLDNPLFGFTMERIWGLVLQCATDGRVAARCPSLLSGKGIGGDVRDCQCLDSE